MKTKILRGNDAPFMNKELKKAIYVRSRMKNRFNKDPCNENRAKFKQHRNKCVKLRRKAIRDHFKKATSKGIMSNKEFWDLVKPYLSNKGGLSDNNITLIKDQKIITDEPTLCQLFNDHYINIVQNSSGRKPTNVADTTALVDDRDIVKLILETYKTHPSILAIIEHRGVVSEYFSFNEVTIKEVREIVKSLDCRKSTGEDMIPPKLVSLSADELTVPLTDAINSSIRNCKFPDNGKRAAVSPLDKGEQNKTVEKNFRPISVLNVFSKVFEKIIKKQLMPYLDKTLSIFIAAYRERYGTHHVLIRLIEDWRLKLDNDQIVGAVLMDLSKAFDCIPHDLLIAKLSAYGFDENSLVFIYSYLKRRDQCVRINNVYGSFQRILSGVPQGSVLGPILFNFYINDLLFFIKEAEVYNYADDNSLVSSSKSMSDLLKVLEGEANVALKWLKENEMIANPGKFQAILIKKDRSDTSGIDISLSDKNIKSEKTVKLLGIKLDNKLNFDPHISDLCKKAATQLNVLKRLKQFIGFEEKKILVQSFVYSNFNYCPLVWHFSSAKSLQKVERIQERALRFLFNDNNSTYEELLTKSGKNYMHVSRLRALCIEIYKTMKQLNPVFMQNIFSFKSSVNLSRSQRNPYDLLHHRPNQTNFGTNSLRALGPKIWNGLPNEMKSAQNIDVFKRLIKQWDGVECNCNACQFEKHNIDQNQ